MDFLFRGKQIKLLSESICRRCEKIVRGKQSQHCSDSACSLMPPSGNWKRNTLQRQGDIIYSYMTISGPLSSNWNLTIQQWNDQVFSGKSEVRFTKPYFMLYLSDVPHLQQWCFLSTPLILSFSQRDRWELFGDKSSPCPHPLGQPLWHLSLYPNL